MMTLRLYSGKFESVPAATSWYLADLGEARDKQELFTRQSPQRLKALRDHALIESAVSSNRIEGVEVEQSRIASIVFGRPLLRDRDEEEVRGYRQVLTWIHGQGAKIPISEATVLQIHRMARGNASANFRVPRARKRVSFFTLSTVLSVLSACLKFRTSAPTSAWIWSAGC